MSKNSIIKIEDIQNRIFTIRGLKIDANDILEKL